MAITQTYNDKVVRQFALMTVVWGVVGMAVGVAVWAFFWATDHGQFDDLETPPIRILQE